MSGTGQTRSGLGPVAPEVLKPAAVGVVSCLYACALVRWLFHSVSGLPCLADVLDGAVGSIRVGQLATIVPCTALRVFPTSRERGVEEEALLFRNLVDLVLGKPTSIRPLVSFPCELLGIVLVYSRPLLASSFDVGGLMDGEHLADLGGRGTMTMAEEVPREFDTVAITSYDGDFGRLGHCGPVCTLGSTSEGERPPPCASILSSCTAVAAGV